jgi:hypothetical protein
MISRRMLLFGAGAIGLSGLTGASLRPLYVHFGDSTIEFTTIPAIVGRRCGMRAINSGFGGTCLTHHGDPSYDALSMVRLARAVATAQFADQRRAVIELDSHPDRYLDWGNAEILDRIEAVGFTVVSDVVLSFGTNDYSSNVPLDAFRSAIDLVAAELRGTAPSARLLFATPYWHVGCERPNGIGLMCAAYVDAMVDQARINGDASLDLYRSSEIGPDTAALYLRDGKHLNDAGAEMVAALYAKAIKAEPVRSKRES